MSGADARRAMDPGNPGPEGFQVFLSHSGSQKDFVAQLDKDLRAWDVHPFFDEDVEKRSLPIGEKVQDRIFKAIEDCRVGVVILSEEFFTRTVWPMLELEKMVECKKKIMPVFLGISPEELSNESKLGEWISAWKDLEKTGMKINIPNWVGAVKHLREVKGLKLVHKDGTALFKFREEIAKEIRKEAPPRFRWDDSHVQGGTRLSEVIQAKIRGIGTAHEGVRVLGLHGIGGIGKTTACKSLCKDLLTEFDGRVCHIEFGADSSERSELERVQKVLKRLTNVDNGFLKDKDKDECWSLLKEHLAFKEPLSSNKVFLAIDNVSSCQKTYDEVEKYLSLEYDQGSVVMVTARGLGELGNLSIETSNYLEMPELVKDEARALFLNHAKPKSVVDEGIVMECVNRCCFGKGDGGGCEHYHPLALKVLGSQLIGRLPSDWISQLEEEDVFNGLQEQENPVFLVLRRSFDALKDEHKKLFMDVALFDDGGDLKIWKILEQSDFNIWHIIDEMRTWYTIFDWLRIVHGISMSDLKKRLSELKRRALLEELGDGTSQIGMHDLWREFAVMEAKHGEEGSSHWVYEHDVLGNQESAESCMASGGWNELRRICITTSSVKHMNFNECSKVTVLKLNMNNVLNGSLDLSQMKLIKILEIVQLENPWKYLERRNNEEVKQDQVSGIGRLSNLVVLVLWNVGGGSLSAVEEVSFLTNLRILHLKVNFWSDYKLSPMSLDLQELRCLQDVRVELPGMVSICGFSSRMKGLRYLDLSGCYQLMSCASVGNVDGLEVLLLCGCSKLEEVPNLQKLIRLRILGIKGCELLKSLPGLGSLVALQVLYGGNACLAMKELPSISNLAMLEVLDLKSCYELKCIPGLGDLITLRELYITCRLWHGLPDLRSLTKLQRVWISGSADFQRGCGVSGSVLNLAMLESISRLSISHVDHELANLHKLTSLRSLELNGCNFERLPHMGKDMILELLSVVHCGRLTGWDGVQGLGSRPHSRVGLSCDWTLSYLKYLNVMYCQSLEVLPDLRHFPQLKMLYLVGSNPYNSRCAEFVVRCHASHAHLETLEIKSSEIKELPNLGKFPSLQEVVIRDCNSLTNLTINGPWQKVDISNCNSLTNLTINGPLPTLSSIMLSRYKNLRMVPNINLFPRLTEFSFQQCGELLNEHEIQKLTANGFRDNCNGLFRRDRRVM